MDCLIIDEISMLSQKLFLQLEHVVRAVRNKSQPFDGMQVVLVGDYFQLKPVPNSDYNDPGETILAYQDIRKLVPQHFVLTKAHRQTEGENMQY
jgi:ATP-dependent DNA helicase PIF1